MLGAWAGRALAGPPLEIYPLAIASIVAISPWAAYGSLRDALLALGLLTLTVAIAAEAGTGGDAAPDLVPSLFLAGGVWTVGRIARRRHDNALAVERSVDERAAEAAAGERRRIARELHDGGPPRQRRWSCRPRRSPGRLAETRSATGRRSPSIDATGRQAMGEMRRLLGG